MSPRRIPLVPTLLVLAAAGIMVRLGFWQLDRLHQKEAMLARFAAAQTNVGVLPDDIDTFGRRDRPEVLYHRASFECAKVLGWEAVAGNNTNGDTGIAHIAHCEAANWRIFDRLSWQSGGEDRDLDVVVGWSRSPAQPDWKGGSVSGQISPGGQLGLRLVADPPLAGLEANAKPDPANIPNNHLSYAVQWFLFAATALVIYALALKKCLAAA